MMFSQCTNLTINIIFILEFKYFTNSDPKSLEQELLFKVGTTDILFSYIEQLFLSVEQLDQLEVCLPYSRLLTGITKYKEELK